MTKPLSNTEIVTLAVYLEGGDRTPVDSEDVAVRANRLAPGRFSWRKYPQQIDIESVRRRIREAATPDKGGYLFGGEDHGWQLTEAGLAFAKEHSHDTQGRDVPRPRLNRRETLALNRERGRMLAEKAFSLFASGGLDAVGKREAEAFFRLDDYIVGSARERRVLRALNSFASDPELGPVVRALADRVRVQDDGR